MVQISTGSYKVISYVVPDDHGEGMKVYNGNYMLCIHARRFHECMQAIFIL